MYNVCSVAKLECLGCPESGERLPKYVLPGNNFCRRYRDA